MNTYEIAWGHSGSRGHEWNTAREASRYAANTWGTVEAESPEAAVEVVRADVVVDDWYEQDGVIHVVGPMPEEEA